jgi:hypothetical protein
MVAMSPKPAWKIYTLVMVALVPTWFAWIFSMTALFPKVEKLWRDFGPQAEGRAVSAALEFIISFSRFAFGNSSILVGLAVLVVVLLEIRWKSWARWRSVTLATLTVLLNAFVMLSLVLMTTLALLLSARALVLSGEQP